MGSKAVTMGASLPLVLIAMTFVGTVVAAGQAPPATAESGSDLFYNNCASCHGTDGKGTPQGSDLTSGKWLWGNGSLQAITRTISQGAPKPKQHEGVMPPLGGTQLSQAYLAAVADYVWALGHQKQR